MIQDNQCSDSKKAEKIKNLEDLSIYLSVCLSIYLSICLSIYLSISILFFREVVETGVPGRENSVSSLKEKAWCIILVCVCAYTCVFVCVCGNFVFVMRRGRFCWDMTLQKLARSWLQTPFHATYTTLLKSHPKKVEKEKWVRKRGMTTYRVAV
jgi:hypothetical protein